MIEDLKQKMADISASQDYQWLVPNGQAVAAIAALAGLTITNSCVLDAGIVSGPRTRGTSMRRVGDTDDGFVILEDRSGRRYVKDKKGTIRRAGTEALRKAGLLAI